MEGGGLIGRSVYKYTVCPCCITSCLQPTQPTAMAFNGTWKVDRNDNYDKFMEQMGECEEHRASFSHIRPDGRVLKGLSHTLILLGEPHTVQRGVYGAPHNNSSSQIMTFLRTWFLGKRSYVCLFLLCSTMKALTSWSASWQSTTTWRSPSSRPGTSSTSRSPALSAPKTSTSPWVSRSTTAWLMALKSQWVSHSWNNQQQQTQNEPMKMLKVVKKGISPLIV